MENGCFEKETLERESRESVERELGQELERAESWRVVCAQIVKGKGLHDPFYLYDVWASSLICIRIPSLICVRHGV